MTVISSPTTEATPVTTPSGVRVAGLAGIASAVLLFLGVAVLNPPLHADDTELVAWWSDRTNQISAAVSMYLFIASALLFLGFLSHLYARLRAADRTGPLATLVLANGIAYASALTVAATARGVIGKATALSDQPLPGADTVRYLMELASVALGVVAMLAITATIVSFSYAILRTDAFGRWLAWLGTVAAVVLVAMQGLVLGALAIPAILVWTIGTSLAIWRARALPARVAR